MALIQIIAAYEATDGKITEQAPLRYRSNEAGLIATLEHYWALTRELAGMRGAVPRLLVCNADRSRSIVLRDPPLAPSDPTEQARSIYAALVMLLEPCAEHPSGTHARARSVPPQASAERASGAHPLAPAGRASARPSASGTR
jgi:hypothetical protein